MWPLIYRLNTTRFNEKVRRNFVSFCHCLTTLLLNNFNVKPRVALLWSASYFIWDCGYIITKSRPIELFNLLHHGVAIGALTTTSVITFKYQLLILMEMSNIPNYIVYDLIKSEKDSRLMRVIQLVWFGYFRIVKTPQFVYSELYKYNINKIELVCTLLILGMGYIWTFVMGKQLTKLK
jgi:hypothetical protein